MRREFRFLPLFAAVAIAVVISLAGATRPVRAADDEKKKEVDYTKDIHPIFKAACIKCHSLDNPRKKASSGFRMDNKEDMLKGGKSGKDIIPGNAKDSVLYKLLLGTVTVDGEEIEAMPKAKKGEHFKPLEEKQIELVKDWIDQGAKF